MALMRPTHLVPFSPAVHNQSSAGRDAAVCSVRLTAREHGGVSRRRVGHDRCLGAKGRSRAALASPLLSHHWLHNLPTFLPQHAGFELCGWLGARSSIQSPASTCHPVCCALARHSVDALFARWTLPPSGFRAKRA